MFAASARPALADVHGEAGTWTDAVTSTATAVTVVFTDRNAGGTDELFVAEISVPSATIADPQPSDTWSDGTTTWTVEERLVSAQGGRHLCVVSTPRTVLARRAVP